MEDREEKADYPTVVVHGLEIQEKRARVRSFKQGDNNEWKETAAVTENVLLLIFESVTAHSKTVLFNLFLPPTPSCQFFIPAAMLMLMLMLILVAFVLLLLLAWLGVTS